MIQVYHTYIGNFYPRSPCGERLWPGLLARPFFIISIHALLAESDTWQRGSRITYVISIHALLAESDPCRLQRHADDLQISIHALLAESDVFVCHLLILLCIFLSTLSLRRATRQPCDG